MDLFGDDIIEEEFEEDEDKSSDSEQPAEGLKHPRLMFDSFGHEAVEKHLLELYAAARLPHGLIFAGPEGVGKATFAFRFARFLFKNPPADPNQVSMFGDAPPAPKNFNTSPEDPVIRRIGSGAHPDLLTIERAFDPAKNRAKDSVDVTEIRKVPSFLRMTASEGGWRVVIIDDADTMNRNAQNALLKVLEEPPPHTVLILIAHRPGALIPTIRSRAQLINFQPLHNEIISGLLSRQGHSFTNAELAALSYLAAGSIGKAVQYVEQGGLDTLGRILAALENYPRWNWPELHNLANDLGGYGREQSYHAFAELLHWTFVQLAVSKARGTAIGARVLDIGALQGFLQNSSLEHILKICENLQSHFAKADISNLDKRQAVLSAFSLIAA
jgi:DNA polymerase III subunit delta'